MRGAFNRRIVFALALLVMIATGSGQWLRLPLPDTPRMLDGKPDLLAPAPKARDGKPDLSGIWEAIRPPHTADGSGRVGFRRYFPPDFLPPLQPWAKTLWDKRYEVDLGAGRPSERCLPHIVPDALFFGPSKFVQTPRVTIILHEEFNFFRQIHTDGRSLPTNPEPAWFGYSVAAWQEDTLVVITQGFRIASWSDYGWLDDSGIPYTKDLRITERYRRINFGRLHLDVTFEDPSTFTEPWDLEVDFALQPDTELIEFVCENERDLEHLSPQ